MFRGAVSGPRDKFVDPDRWLRDDCGGCGRTRPDLRFRIVSHAFVVARAHVISLLSFNCLRKGYGFRENTWCAPEHRAWPHRRELLERLMTRDLGQLDFLCLQEVEEPDVDLSFLDAAFGQVSAVERSAGAHSFTKPRLYYRRAAWELLWVESRSRAVVGAFRGSQHNEVVYVINVHLTGGPSEEATRERENQIKSALKFLKKRSGSAGERADSAALIVAGDFNATETFSVLTNSMKLTNVMQHNGVRYPSHQWGCTQNGAPNCFQSVIDQIYVRCAILVLGRACWWRLRTLVRSSHYHMVAARNPFTAEQWTEVEQRGVPNAFHPSDHMPLCVRLARTQEPAPE